jgi:glycosyltransferase involved in cell wall biosynthesis
VAKTTENSPRRAATVRSRMTTVTVIIPVYNRADTIGRAVESVMGQTGGSTDVIVVDDHSSDDLAGALAPYGERLVCIRHDVNGGAASARNTGITAAHGDYVAFLDSDDVWLPGKLDAQIAAMRSNNWKASCTAYYLARAGMAEVVSPRHPTTSLGFDDLIWGCVVSPGSTLVCERSVFDDVGLFDPTMRRLEDWDWLLRYTKRHPVGFLAQPLARIEPSDNQDFTISLEAIEAMRSRHMPAMAGSRRRHFAAALDVERAAAYHRRGDMIPAVAGLLRSFMRAPWRNVALAAVLHNRFGRG